jgi:chromate transport protein ChrA
VLYFACRRFTALYKTYGQLPQVQPFIYGIKPAIMGLAALRQSGGATLKSFFPILLSGNISNSF